MFATSSRGSFIGLALVGLSTQVALAGTESPRREGEVEEYTATGAVLLFKTGFEDCTTLSTVDEYFIDNGWVNNQSALQYFSGFEGTSLVNPNPRWCSRASSQSYADFSWPPEVPLLTSVDLDGDGTADPIYLNNIVGQDNDNPTTDYMWNELVETVGPDGRETRALSMEMMNNPDGTETGQNNLVMRYDESEEPPPLYIQYWMKPSEEIYAALLQDGVDEDEQVSMWHLISEMKAETDDDETFRLQVQISFNPGDGLPSYQLRADYCAPDAVTGEFRCTNPEYWSVVVELTEEEHQKWENGEWMPVEIYLDRNPTDDTDDRFYVAINGRTIGDLSSADIDPATGDHYVFWDVDYTPQSFWLLQSLYGLRDVTPHRVLIDDLEFWDDFPCSTPPCEAR